jgi:2,4-didehydro-3-deoxy-L-rhamnonate hydrolase
MADGRTDECCRGDSVKLLRYGPAGHEKPALLAADATLRDLSGVIENIAGPALTATGIEGLRRLDPNQLPTVSGTPRIGPPVAQVGKIICVGLNFADHAAESGMPVPEVPVIFMKATSALVGPDDNIVIPRASEKTDWEVELGVVIGDVARDVTRAEALRHVAGYLIVNDVSERAFQLEHGGQWVKGKSCDTFAPIGPWLVTRDEVPNTQNLRMWLDVNGHRYQHGNTKTMIFDVPHLVSYISRYMTLMPGDLISTGTPPGVGMGQKPQVFLRPGDIVTLGIEGLGQQCQHVVATV